MPDVAAKRVVVIGGGIAGLAAARRIQSTFQAANRPLNLLLFDAAPQPGGFLKTTMREGFLLESGADCFISEKPRGVELCRELGLESELIPVRKENRRSYILRDGIFHPVPEGFYLMGPTRRKPFLKSGLLSWSGKFRTLLEPWIPAHPATDESVAAFVRRRFGQELLDWMAQPLLAGIYGADAEELSLRATFPKFLEMERTYGSVLLGLKKRAAAAAEEASGARYSLFVTLRHGMQTLTDAMAKQLGPAVIRSGAPVRAISKSSFPDGAGGASRESWHVQPASGQAVEADAVCVALPSYAASDLVRPFDPDLSDELSAIPYAPAATINFAFRDMDVKRSLNGVGFVVPQKENKLILGCTFAQNKFDGRAPQGFILARAFLGGEHGTPWTGEKDDVLTQKVLAELTEWLGITRPPLFTQMERYDRSLPLYAIGHLERIVKIEDRLFRHKGLGLAGNYQYGVGVPDCIMSGERAAIAMTQILLRHS